MDCPRITCAVCDTLIEMVEWYDEPHTMDRVILVHCHGQVETVRIPATVWMDFTPRDVTWGRAFEQRRIA